MKQEPVHAAQRFVDKRFPNCSGAILAGSIVRGEWTTTSDLDIVILMPLFHPLIENPLLIMVGQLNYLLIT